MSASSDTASSTSSIESSNSDGPAKEAVEGALDSEKETLLPIKVKDDDEVGKGAQEDSIDHDDAVFSADYDTGTIPPEIGAEGLVTLWHPSQSDDVDSLENHFLNDLDIITVHGLWGARQPSWKNAGSGNSDWLETKGHCGHLMSFGYDPSRLLSGLYTRRSLDKLATLLLDNVTAQRKKSAEKRFIMFVAHDLGGIIVKAALTIAGLNPRLYGEVFDFTRVLIFYGCPHRASDIREMEENLTRFLYHPCSAPQSRSPSLVGTARHLAIASIATNGLFMDSKHMFRSHIISIYSENDVADMNKVFNRFSATMEVTFEICLGYSTKTYSQIKEYVERIKSFTELDNDTIRNERCLLSNAPPPQPMGLNLVLDHPFAWIDNNEQYKLWCNKREPQLLYLRSKSDTQLASEYIFHSLCKSHTRSIGQVTLYFTFDRHDLRRNKIEDMLSSFLAQILGHYTAPAKLLGEQLRQHLLDRSWNYKDLFNWFEDNRTFAEIKGISCVLNHFDECLPTSRDAFLKSYAYVSETQERPWRILVTTQVPGVLSNELSRWPVLDLDQSVFGTYHQPFTRLLNSDATTAFDLVTLLGASTGVRGFKIEVNDDVTAIKSLELDVQELILKHVSRNERWPSQQRISDILGPIERMDLESVVIHILSNIPDQDFALYALSWILYAVRPVTLWELATAVTHHTEDRAPNNPFSVPPPIEEVHDKLLTWFAGIVTIQQNEVVISSRRIRDILVKPSCVESQAPSLTDRLRKTAHTNILRTCLAYLSIPETQIGLQDIYNNSRYDDTHLAMIHDRTSLHNYAAQFWVHHLSSSYANYYPSDEIESFVKSGALSTWAEARWALANPLTRSQRPLKSLYPILLGAGLSDQAERWLSADDDLSAGLIEVCLNASLHTTQQLLSHSKHSVEYLNEALIAAGANGNEDAWIALVNSIQNAYPDFSWKSLGTLVIRASWLGSDKVLIRLLELGCPSNELDPARSVTPLRVAVRANNVSAAKILLNHDADPKEAWNSGWTLVNSAALFGLPEMIKLLISYGADPNAMSSAFTSPLYNAAFWGKPKAVEALIESGANPNLKVVENQNDPGWSALTCAISRSHIGCARALLSGNADPDILGDYGTPIRYAVAYGLLDICERLLERRADMFHESITQPLLIEATRAENGETRLEIMRLLVNKGVHINAEDSDGNTALFWACWSDDPRRLSIIEYLLEQGANVNCRSHNGTRPLHIGASRGDPTLLSLLLRQEDIDVNALGPGDKTPLIMAIGNESMVKMLLEKGADPNVGPKGDGSALLGAIRGNSPEVVTLLVQYKARIDPPDELQNDSLWEPLEYAVVFGLSNIIRILADAGADVNRRFPSGRTLLHKGVTNTGLAALLEFRPILDVKDVFGDTPLHDVWGGSAPKENFKLLLRAGSDINARNNVGATPLIMALSRNYQGVAPHRIENDDDNTSSGRSVDPKMELVTLLIDAGADISMSTGFSLGTVGVAAAKGCSRDQIKALTHRGIDFTVSDSMGRRPVHIAATRGLPDVLDSVLDAGNRAVGKDKSGRNAVSWAAQGGSANLLHKLLELTGVQSIHEPDLSGWTPLCWAARGKGKDSGSETSQYDMVNELLRLGADRSVKSNIPGKEHTPAGIATYHGCEDVLKLLTLDNEQDGVKGSGSTDGLPHLPDNTKIRENGEWCDFCLFVIQGIRYQCTTCWSFDFCYKCYSLKDKLHPLDHEFNAVGDEFTTSDSNPPPRSSSPEPSSSSSESTVSSDSDDESSTEA